MILITKFESLLQKQSVKILLTSFLISLTTVGYAYQYSETVHNDIASNVVRFHCIANSDSVLDQSLKLKVRDGVTQYLRDKLDGANSLEETKQIINSRLMEIQEVARGVLAENNCSYPVKAVTGVFDFPTKAYGSTKLPQGEYYALRIIIGEGKGQNWWCVLYPGLCYGELNKDTLKNVLSEDSYNVITDSDGNIQYKFKFRVLELFGK